VISSLFTGFILGAGAAIPLGPINILIMTNALRSYKSAVALGLGAMSADIIYFLLTMLSGLELLKYNIFATILTIFGSLFLLYIAYQIFKSRNNDLEVSKQNPSKTDILKSYTKGLSLTLLNPYTIGFWLSIAGVFYILLFIKRFESLNIIGLFLALHVWVYCAMLPITLAIFSTFSLYHPLSILFSMLFNLFYPLSLFAHIVSMADIFDPLLSKLLALEIQTIRYKPSEAFMVVYILSSLLSVKYTYFFYLLLLLIAYILGRLTIF